MLLTTLLAASLPLCAQETMLGPLAQRLDSAVRVAESRGFHGNVLVTDQGRVILLKGYGLANVSSHTPFSPTTLVQIGSNVKDFTRVAIYQLIEAGRLRPGDSLARFVDRLPEAQRGITVQHLLQHTAGLPLGVAGDAEPLTREEMLRRLRGLTLLSPPGAQEHYSNLGYSLLALIVEQLSRQTFDAYVAGHVLQPAGLSETGSYLPSRDRARMAHGYSGGRDIGVILDMPHDAEGHLWSLRGNGGYLSTLSEMRRFYQAVSDTVLLRDPEHRRAVFDPDGADIMAGSDLTSFFLFANFPGRAARIFIASNHSDYQGPRLLREIETVLGPPAGPGQRMVTTDGPGPQASSPLLERLPDNGAGRTVAAYLEAYNSGDSSVMRRFFVERGAIGEGTSPIEVRLERYQAMWGNRGRLTFRGVRQADDGLAVTATTARGETATLGFVLEPDPSNRLRGIRVEIGN